MDTETMCQHPKDNHSEDRATVWFGRTEPLNLCGFHASQISPAMFAMLRAEGII